MTNQIQHIAVVGAGYMGGGIAQVLAMAGFDVAIIDADSNLTRRHLDRLGREAEDFEAQGLFEAGSADRVRANLRARVNDKAGFVLNRLQYVLLKEAINLAEEGVATAEDIDIVVRTRFGFRLPFFGPFAIADMAGLDVYEDCFRTFEEYYGGSANRVPQHRLRQARSAPPRAGAGAPL